MPDDADVAKPKKRISAMKIIVVSCAVLTVLLGLGVYLIYHQLSTARSNPYWDVDYLRIFRQVSGLESNDPKNLEHNQATFNRGLLRFCKGMFADTQKQTDLAIDLYREALQEFEVYPGFNNLYALDCMSRLAVDLDSKGQTAESEKMYKSAVDCAAMASNKKCYLVARSLSNLGCFYDKHARAPAALKAFRDELALDRAGLSENDRRVENDCWWIADELMRAGKFDEAQENLLRAVRIAKAIGRDDDLGPLIFQQGRCAYSLHQYPQSRVYFADAELHLGKKDRQTYSGRLCAANAFLLEGNKSAADLAANAAVPQDNLLASDSDTMQVYEDDGDYFAGRGNNARAEELYRMSLGVGKRQQAGTEVLSAYVLARLGGCLMKENKVSESTDAYKQMLDIDRKFNLHPPEWVRSRAMAAFIAGHRPELAKILESQAAKKFSKAQRKSDDDDTSNADD